MNALAHIKKCSCGKTYEAAPTGKLFLGRQSGLLWFNCTCGSTIAAWPKVTLINERRKAS